MRTGVRRSARAVRVMVLSVVSGTVLNFAWATSADAAETRRRAAIEKPAPLQIAQSPERIDMAIPPQPLASALTALATRVGARTPDLTGLQGIGSPGASGSLTREEALARLLSDTGYTGRFAGGNVIVLERLAAVPPGAAATPPGAVLMEPIDVQARRASPPTGTIDNLPPAYPGGQVARGARVGVLGNRDIMDVPFSATAFTAETVRNQQAYTLGEVLASDPAVRTTTGFGNFSEQFIIRGYPLFNDDIAIDGLYGTAPRQIIAPELYERVEVLRGASAFLNGVPPGGSGIGGNVNLVPKRAGDEPLTRITGTYAQDSQFGGAFDVGRRFGAGGEFGARFNGVYREGDTSIDRENRSTGLGGLALDYRGERARATLDLSYQRQRVDEGRPDVFVTGNVVPKAPQADKNYAAPYAFTELKDSAAQLRAEYDLVPFVTAYAVVGVRETREDGDYANPTVNGLGIGTIGRLTVPREDTNITGEAGFRGEGTTGPIRHRLNGGFLGIHQTNHNSFEFAGAQPTTLYDPPPVARPRTTSASGSFSNLPTVSRTELKSIFVSDTASILNERVSLTAGLRNQNIEVEGYDRVSGARTSAFDQSALTPVVGVVVKPLDNLSLYFNRIESLAQGPTAPTTAVNSGEIFSPFVSTQYEFGGKLDFGRIAASIALFDTSRPTGITDPITRRFGITGEQHIRGIELLTFGEPVTGVRVLGGVTLLEARLQGTAGGVNDGNSAVGVPDYQFNIGAEWDLPFLPRLTVSGRIIHTGPEFLNEPNTQRISSWTRLDLGARYGFDVDGRLVVVRANVENVSNENYWASAFGGYLVQGNPLTAKLSVGVDF